MWNNNKLESLLFNMYGSTPVANQLPPSVGYMIEGVPLQNVERRSNRLDIAMVVASCLTVGAVFGVASNMDFKTVGHLYGTVTSLKAEKETSTTVPAALVVSAKIDSLLPSFGGEPSILTGITAATNAVRVNVNPPAIPALPG